MLKDLTLNDAELLKTQCSTCKNHFSVPMNQVTDRNNNSLFECPFCSQKIKISLCPSCGISYSIAISSAKPGKYYLKCRKCNFNITVDLPSSSHAIKIEKPEKATIENNAVYTSSSLTFKNLGTPSREEIIQNVFKTQNQGFKEKFPLTSGFLNKEKSIKNGKEEIIELPKKEEDKKGLNFPKHPFSFLNKKKTVTIKKAETIIDKNDIPGEKFTPSFSARTLNRYELKEFLTICYSSLNPFKLIISCIGVTLILFTIYFYNEMFSPILDTINRQNYYLRSFMNFFPFALIFSIYTTIAAIISKMTLDSIFNKKISYFKDGVFTLKVIAVSMVSNILTLLILNSFMVFLTRIPIVGTLAFSAMFLPLYLSAMISLIVLFVGFWFYPPVIAHRQESIIKSPYNFFIFLKKHNFSLFIVVPILFLTISIIITFGMVLHQLAFKIIRIIALSIISADTEKVFSAVPNNLFKIGSITLFGGESNIFRVLTAGLSVTHHMSGFILGIVLCAISVSLIGIVISLISTLSTHTYMMLERNIDTSDRQKISLLLILFLFISGLLVFKKLFF